MGKWQAAVVAAGVSVLVASGEAAAAARTTHHRHAPPCSGKSLVATATPLVQRNGPSGAVVCDGGTGAADASVTVRLDPSTRQGYAVYQGRPHDTIPPGYVGADTQNRVTIVGCDTGTYDPKARDEWNQSPRSRHNNAQIAAGTDEFTAPVGPIGPGDPCSPFVPHTPPGRSCGSPQDPAPTTVLPAHGSPLNAYATSPAPSPTGRGDAGLTGDFGGGDGASGYLQATYGSGAAGPTGNVTTGGNSRGGGGTVAVGNDGNETDDPFTPAGSPVVLCQD